MDEKTTKVLLIDLENCPSQINQLMNHLDEYSHIVICYAQSGAKIPIDWMMLLTKVINEGRLKLIKMPEVGKNAADFGLAFWAGVLMAQLPENTHFDIVSNDTDLDYAVSLLASENRSAERRGIQKEASATVATSAQIDKILHDYINEYCVRLVQMINSKPSTQTTLVNDIQSKFRASNLDAKKFLDVLVSNGVVSINDNKVSYYQQRINQFAKVN